MIFVSYRREDTRSEVILIRDRLVKRYGVEAVFVDESSIDPGAVWPEVIEHRLLSSRVLLAVVGGGWMTWFTTGKQRGFPRLSDPDDWVRREICTAFRKAIPVFVVRIDGATLPETMWSCELDELHKIQAIEIRTGNRFDSDLEELLGAMEKRIPELADHAFRNTTAPGPPPMSPGEPSVMAEYLATERRHHETMQLPPIALGGQPVIAQLQALRIELPLIVNHERALSARSSQMRPITEIAGAGGGVHASSVLVDRARRDHAEPRHCEIGGALTASNHLVIVGAPGSGKSTLLQWLCWHYASRSLDGPAAARDTTLPDRELLPILVRCRDLAASAPLAHISDLLRAHLKLRQFSESASIALIPYFERMFGDGKAMLLVDGLDEIPAIDHRVHLARLLTSIARRFADAPVVITSRMVGFQAVQAELAGAYDHLRVGPLDAQARRSYVARWSRLLDWDSAREASMVRRVCDLRDTASLAENVFLLAMVAQIPVAGGELLHRMLDVCRRAVDLMIQRRQPGEQPPLGVNEVVPHLELLAYRMRKQGLQRFTEHEATEAFRELRRLEARPGALQLRSPEALLRACIDPVGLLSIAGVMTDAGGFDQPIIEFVHPSFQDYFAGQALVHGRGAAAGEGVVARLRHLVDSIAIRDQTIDVRGFKLSEPVLADLWQESLRSAIAGLALNDADDALVMLLPTSATLPREARPRAVFALRCLLERPPVSETTITAVLDAAIDQVDAIDSGGLTTDTTMDDVLKAAYASVYADRLHQRLIDAFVASRGDQRNRIGSCVLAALRARPGRSSLPASLTAETAPAVIESVTRSLGSNERARRIEAAFDLVHACFLASGQLGFLTPDQAAELVDALVSAAQRDEATSCAAMWALSWLTGARIRLPLWPGTDPDQPQRSLDHLLDTAWPHHLIADRAATRRSPRSSEPSMVLLRGETVVAIEQILQQPDVDPYALAYGALALNRDAELSPVNLQRDWIALLAQVADGTTARRELQLGWGTRSIRGKRRSTRWLCDALGRPLPQPAAMRIAQALGACGDFTPELVPPLRELFLRGRTDFALADRDEAMLYLAFGGGPDATRVLIEAADTPPEYDDYLSTRGLFGLLLLDNVLVLANQLCKALPHAQLDAYAYGLAGSNDRRQGRLLLEQRRGDANPRVRAAVRAALDNDRLDREWLSFMELP